LKVAFFSCIAGGYEESMRLIRERSQSDQVVTDMFVFVDDAHLNLPPGYKKVLCNYINPIPVLIARYVKTHPHICFSDYDYAVWIDSNIMFYGDIYEYINLLERRGAECGFIHHPTRASVLDELQVLCDKGVVEPSAGKEQI